MDSSLFVGAFAVLFVLATLTVLLRQRKGSASLPYRKQESLLTKTEQTFYCVLSEAVGTQHLVFSKVRLADVLYLPKNTPNWLQHFNRISSKHVDFVLCDPQSLAPRLLIELDDSSHQRPDRQKRDRFVNEAVSAAELPILHVPAKAPYNPMHLRSEIQRVTAAQ